jgi:hypothetical protein
MASGCAAYAPHGMGHLMCKSRAHGSQPRVSGRDCLDGFRGARAVGTMGGEFDTNPRAKWQRTSDIPFFLWFEVWMRVAPSIPFPALVGIWNYRYRWGGGSCADAGLVLAVVAVVVACTLGVQFYCSS